MGIGICKMTMLASYRGAYLCLLDLEMQEVYGESMALDLSGPGGAGRGMSEGCEVMDL